MDKNSQQSRALHRRFKTLKTLIFSRILIVVLLLLVQIGIFMLPVFIYMPYVQNFFLVSSVISLLFCFYLVNSPGRNEFKIAWLIPVLILPFFGIALFFLFKKNLPGTNYSKRLKKIKNYSRPFLSDVNTEKKAMEIYPKVRDISNYLKNSAGFSTFTNTETKYFSCGENFFPVMLEDLKKAEKFIFVEYFVIEESFMWSKILEILVEKASAGVEVFILYDSLGSVTLATRRYENFLKKQGLNAKIFSPFIPVYDTALNNRDHRKLIDIDGKVAYTGGLNISDEYINLNHKRFSYWKDAAIRIEGPAVKTFTVTFLQLWYLQNKKTELNFSDFDRFVNVPKNLKDTGGIVIPYGNDAYSDSDIAEDVYNYILSKSHDYVHIMTPYFIIDNALMNSMIFAARRGVEVSIIVPEKYDHFLTFCVGRKFIRQLISNGVRVFTYKRGFIHSKIFVSDDKRATVGSINLDYRSLFHHFECGVYLYQNETVSEIEMDFQETLKYCRELTLSEYKKIPLSVRITGWIFKVFAPLL
mgnify:FL=1